VAVRQRDNPVLNGLIHAPRVGVPVMLGCAPRDRLSTHHAVRHAHLSGPNDTASLVEGFHRRGLAHHRAQDPGLGITDSVGLLSDALESFVNLAGAMFALVMVTVAARPADKDHPFGHHKAEYFS